MIKTLDYFINNPKSKTIVSNIFAFFSFLVLGFLVFKLLAPETNSNAEDQTVEGTVGPYTISMSSNDNVSINVTPTNDQKVFTKDTNLTLTNTCPAGATITIETSSTSSNALTRVGDDSETKTISATTGTSLNNNSWGFSLDDGETYNEVPVRNGNTTYIYNEVESANNKEIPLLFGIKTDNNMPSGTYTNDIVYTLTPKAGCLTYSLSWDLNGGTGKSGASYTTVNKNWGDTINLTNYTPTRSGYTFTGWSNGTDTFNGTETDVDVNPNNSANITLTANWRQICTDCEVVDVDLNVNESQGFDYIGKVAQATIKKAGYYKLEVWGAQGGKASSTIGGYGGYAVGSYNSSIGDTLYVVVGGTGVTASSSQYLGGYNGGGDAYPTNTETRGSSGGGATHIAKRPGILSTLQSYQSDVLIVAGGGGGTSCGYSLSNNGGQSGGGYIGSAPSGTSGHQAGYGGTQSAGGEYGTGGGKPYRGTVGSFGKGGTAGGSSSNASGGGGGGGWYGGGGGESGASTCGRGGGGGSGYIGNQLLVSTNNITKQMYMFENGNNGCSASSEESTKTTCITNAGAHISEYANTGNGYAKITYLGTSI